MGATAAAPGLVTTVPRQEWDALSIAARRRLFESQAIHVVGASSSTVLPGVEGWDPSCLASYLDMDDRRFVHGA